MDLLTMYVQRRNLDEPAIARLSSVLRDAGASPAGEAGDFLMALVVGPDLAADTSLRVFAEVYGLGPDYELEFSGDRAEPVAAGDRPRSRV
jgi:hypothetical protein